MKSKAFLLHVQYVAGVPFTGPAKSISLVGTDGATAATFVRDDWHRAEDYFYVVTGFLPENYAPAGKRSLKRNVYGNVVGFVSGHRYKEFGGDYGRNGAFSDAQLAWLNAKPFTR